MDIHEWIDTSFVIVTIETSQNELVQLIASNKPRFIILVDSLGLPTRAVSTEDMLAEDRTAEQNFAKITRTWKAPTLIDSAVPSLTLLSLLSKPAFSHSEIAIVLEDKLPLGVVSKRYLESKLAEQIVSKGLNAERYHDVYGLLTQFKLPNILCYRCIFCDFGVTRSVFEDIPVCIRPWHGRLELENCPEQEF